MKFRSLCFSAFGPFTEHRLELNDSVGFHLFHGPNEAGKSSMLRGIRSLLYGIDHRTKDDFLHSKPDLRLRAVLSHSDGREMEFVRKKARDKTLLDAEGKVLDEALLGNFLGGVDRELFERLYGLDHRTLVEGGQALLQGEGDIGQSLFAAGLGPALRSLAKELETQASSLWRERAHVLPLNRAVATFKEARKKVGQQSLNPVAWKGIEQEIATLEKRIKELESELQYAYREQSRVERFAQAHPLAYRRRTVIETLRETPNAPSLDPGFRERRLSLEREREELVAELSRLQDNIEKTEGLLKEETSYERPLAFARPIEEIYRGLDGFMALDTRIRKIETDLGRVQAEGDSLALDLSPGLSRLEMKLPAAGERGQATQLAAAFQLAQKEYATCRETLVEKRRDLQDLNSQLLLEDDSSELEALLQLERLLNRESKLDSEIEDLSRRVCEQERAVQTALSNLPGFHGDIEGLRRLRPLLPEVIERYRRNLEKVSTARAAQEKEVERLRVGVEKQERRREELEGESAPPTKFQLQATRQKRDEIKEKLSQAWASGSSWADSQSRWAQFDESLRESDLLADRRFSDAERVAKIAEADRTILEARSNLERHLEEQTTLEKRLLELRDEWRTQVGTLLETPVSPPELISWQQQRAAVLDEACELERRKGELAAKVGVRRVALQQAQAILSKIKVESIEGESTIHDALEAVARVLHPKLENAKKRDAALLKRTNLDQEIRRLEAQQNRLESELSRLRCQWANCLDSVGLVAKTDPFDLVPLLEKYERLGSCLSQERLFETSLRQLRDEEADYRTRAAQLAGEVLPGEQAHPPQRLAQRMYDSLTQARRAAERRQSLTEKLGELRESVTVHREKLQTVERAQQQLLTQAETDSLEQLPQVEQRAAERDRLNSELAQLEATLHQLSGGERLEAFCDEVLTLDVDLLPAQIDRARERLQELRELEGQTREKLGESRKSKEQLGVSSAGEAAAEAETSAAEIVGLAERYMVLTLSHHLLNRQLEEYRRSHQGPILERAQYAFARLTGGLYPRLETGYDEKDKPVLLACERDNRKVGVEGLSDGTRDQLFLALRLATIEQQLLHHEPVPFVADDLLVHFDSERALAALELLTEFSRKTQVLFFTHLERDRDLASALPPGSVEIHELSRAL